MGNSRTEDWVPIWQFGCINKTFAVIDLVRMEEFSSFDEGVPESEFLKNSTGFGPFF